MAPGSALGAPPPRPISVVIPVRAEGARLLQTIAALSRVRGVGEVIIAACDERGATRRRAERCPRVRWLDCPRASRAEQMAMGAAAARHGVLLFLHADTMLPASAAEDVSRALEDAEVAGGAFRLAFDAAHPALRLLERLSALPWRCAYLGDQGFFCRRDGYERAGGFSPMPLFEDVDLARRLARQGRLVRLASSVRTSARRFTARGPWRQLALNTALLTLHHLGAGAVSLARVYRP